MAVSLNWRSFLWLSLEREPDCFCIYIRAPDFSKLSYSKGVRVSIKGLWDSLWVDIRKVKRRYGPRDLDMSKAFPKGLYYGPLPAYLDDQLT